MSSRYNRSRKRRNELPLGLRLLFGGIVMLVVSSAFAGLGLPGLSDLMGLLAFIGFWMAAGGLLILLAPIIIPLGKALFARLAQRAQPKLDSYWMFRPQEKQLSGNLSADGKPSWDLELLRSLDWKVFEELCADYLRETGFRPEPTPLGADGGVDIWVYSMKDNRRVAAVQCKAWNAWRVGVKPVRELYGVMAGEKVQHGMFVTSGTFTEEARTFVIGKNVKLIDGGDFLAKIKVLSDEAQKRLFTGSTTGDYTTPSCPKCGMKLVRRKSSAGEFWGCPSFPRCRGKLRAAKACAT